MNLRDLAVIFTATLLDGTFREKDPVGDIDTNYDLFMCFVCILHSILTIERLTEIEKQNERFLRLWIHHYML